MLTDKQKLVVEQWGNEVCKHRNEIDEADGMDWWSLFIGFAIGRGLSIEEATNYDLYINFAMEPGDDDEGEMRL